VTGHRDLRFSFSIVGGMAFELVEFTLDEGLSEPFVLNLELACAPPAILAKRTPAESQPLAVIGQPLSVSRYRLPVSR
jgi:uncharacterized protein involved in type VI secretion and phage assembly